MESKSYSYPPQNAMISNAVITGGNFMQHHMHDNRHFQVQGSKGGFEILKEAVAPAAFHNSGERFDPPKCHPNTRVAVIGKIMDWILGCDPVTRNALIMWLTGAAGAGKSAIAQSIAELCYSEGRLLASFFFGRSDPNRNNARSLFATIAYQIALALPHIREQLVAIVEYDPLIFTRSLSTQFTTLIAQPLRDLFDSGAASDLHIPRLIIIDGLDECLDRDVQCSILDVFMNGLQQHHLPLMFLIASRPEHDISTRFNSPEMTSHLTRLILDDFYLPNDDIRIFLRDKFKEIRKTHPFKRSIPASWPTGDVLTGLVVKSSGQFIYASTIIKFVKSSRHQPVNRLEIVLTIRPPSRDLPFAELDALYKHIFSVEEIDQVLHTISFFMLTGDWEPVDVVCKYLSLDPEDLERIFCDLGAVIDIYINYSKITSGFHYNFHILHASLSDFLLDQTRSKEFYIDIHLKRTQHLRKSFQLLTCYDTPVKDSVFSVYSFAMNYICKNSDSSIPMPELRDDILNFSISRIYQEATSQWDGYLISKFTCSFLPSFFASLKTAKFADGDYLYSHLLQSFHQAVMFHLESYYADMRLTFLVLLIDFTIKLKQANPGQYFQEKWILFDIDSSLRNIDILSLILENSDYYYPKFPPPNKYLQLLHGFLDDLALSRECAFDSTKYATAAFVCLAYLCDHTSASQMISPQHTTGRSENRMKHYNMLAWLAGWRGRWMDPVEHTEQEHRTRRNNPWMWLRRNRMHSMLKESLVKSMPNHPGYKLYNDYRYPRRYGSHHPANNHLWTKKYSLALQCLFYFLVRSGRSQELIDFACRHTFASRSQEFPNRSKRVKRAIARYLERMDAAES